MGLDMYLDGNKFYLSPREKVDGFDKKRDSLELGYWRKHPNLHGYIVQTFQNGIDECQKIELTIEDLENILKAVKEDRLPETCGFFFGESCPEDKERDIPILEKAIEWLSKDEENVLKSVTYQASW